MLYSVGQKSHDTAGLKIEVLFGIYSWHYRKMLREKIWKLKIEV